MVLKNYRVDTFLTVYNAFKEHLKQYSTHYPLLIDGAPEENLDEYDDYFRLYHLDASNIPTNFNTKIRFIVFQISTFSKEASRRKDRNVIASLTMTDIVQDCFENKIFPIKRWSSGEENPSNTGFCVRFTEGMEKDMTQRTVGGIQGVSISTPKSGLITKVITYTTKVEVV